MQKQHNGRRRRKWKEHLFGLVVLMTIIVAWIIGGMRAEQDIEPIINKILPETNRIESTGNGVYKAFHSVGGLKQFLGYAAPGEAIGYGGPMTVIVVIAPDGSVFSYSIIDHKETISYLDKVLASELYTSPAGRSVNDAFSSLIDIDAVTGATHSATAFAGAMRNGIRTVASDQLQIQLPPEPEMPVEFGFPEITLLGLFAVGIVSLKVNYRFKKQVRWLTLLTGLVVLGFVLNQPITLMKITSLMLGYVPDWRVNLFWIILLGGVALTVLIFRKSPYCNGFCPFGAAQECIGLIGNAKAHASRKYRLLRIWPKRILAWGAIVLALIFRNPSISSYEVFGGLFALNASVIQFALLISILIASLFIKRPWCTYLCPIDPVVDYLKSTRDRLEELWKRPGRNQVKNQTSS